MHAGMNETNAVLEIIALGGYDYFRSERAIIGTSYVRSDFRITLKLQKKIRFTSL